LPNHCFAAVTNSADELLYDFSVKFNQDMGDFENYGGGDINSVEKSDEILCDI